MSEVVPLSAHEAFYPACSTGKPVFSAEQNEILQCMISRLLAEGGISQQLSSYGVSSAEGHYLAYWGVESRDIFGVSNKVTIELQAFGENGPPVFVIRKNGASVAISSDFGMALEVFEDSITEQNFTPIENAPALRIVGPEADAAAGQKINPASSPADLEAEKRELNNLIESVDPYMWVMRCYNQEEERVVFHLKHDLRKSVVFVQHPPGRRLSSFTVMLCDGEKATERSFGGFKSAFLYLKRHVESMNPDMDKGFKFDL